MDSKSVLLIKQNFKMQMWSPPCSRQGLARTPAASQLLSSLSWNEDMVKEIPLHPSLSSHQGCPRHTGRRCGCSGADDPLSAPLLSTYCIPGTCCSLFNEVPWQPAISRPLINNCLKLKIEDFPWWLASFSWSQ